MNTSLISSGVLIQTPYISVTIGKYTFGTYKEVDKNKQYPNYIQSLEIEKINGQVNKYSLSISFPIDYNTDPNYFEKVFASVSSSRLITFSYGDMSVPNFLYRNEQAIITKIQTSFDISSSKINYTVSAVSQGNLASTGSYTFRARNNVKPSNVIREILQNKYYGLQDLFIGMRNMTLVDKYNLIPSNDVEKNLDLQTNISVLDYLQYLVNSMTPIVGNKSITKKNLFVLTFQDDITNELGGSYFKIVELDNNKEHSEAYELNVGYPNSNCVVDFRVENNENYSIYYEYQDNLHSQNYVSRINNFGEYEDVFAPIISSGNDEHKTREVDKSWWTKVTQYPIKVSLRIKGLLRPAILMTYVKLNLYFYGRKHINSGLYVITKQVDSVDSSGYFTTLNMVKIKGDEDII